VTQPQRPTVVVFDVNETLSDLAPMARRFAEVGAPEQLAATWFASVLRDGFARTAAGAPENFASIAAGVLRSLLPAGPGSEVEKSVEHVLRGFGELSLHPDVPDGIRALRRLGLRLVTLGNGAAAVAERLLSAGGVRGEFERLLSVEDAGGWKPARGAYDHAAASCGTAPADMLLVAAHPWDIDGAARAGLRTAWINRSGGRYPDHFTPPDRTATGIDDLAASLST
jgi:2-haloacid dehalogenase